MPGTGQALCLPFLIGSYNKHKVVPLVPVHAREGRHLLVCGGWRALDLALLGLTPEVLAAYMVLELPLRSLPLGGKVGRELGAQGSSKWLRS